MGQSTSKSLGLPPSPNVGNSVLIPHPPLYTPQSTTGILPSASLSPSTLTTQYAQQVNQDFHHLIAAAQRLQIVPTPKQAQINNGHHGTGTDYSRTWNKHAGAATNGYLPTSFNPIPTLPNSQSMTNGQTKRKGKSQPLFRYDHYGTLIGGNHLGDEFRQLTHVVAIDCEMVGVDDDLTNRDSVLARVSIVNQQGFCLYDTFVKPKLPVTEYRTDKSGVREEDLIHAPPHDLVIREIAGMLKGRIVVGHSVHNDFNVIQLAHPPQDIRDTATYYRALHQTKHFPGLKALGQQVLHWKIQEGEHSSIVDAQASMELYMREELNWEASLKPSWNETGFTTPRNVVNWKMMTVFPRNPELFLDKEFVRPIQVEDPYYTDDAYLDSQFRLLREDFMKPLREGIQEYKKWRHTRDKKVAPVQVRVYENVTIDGNGETKGRRIIRIPVKQKNGDLSSTSEDTRILMNGSLLLFSPNPPSSAGSCEFNSVKLALVNRICPEDDERLKNKGILAITFVPDGPTWKITPTSTFTVLESVPFFEAYRHALENLQVLNMRDWALAKYIRDPTLPFKTVLTGIPLNHLDFSKQVEKTSLVEPVVRSFQSQFPGFPTASQLGLTRTQYEAYHSAITKEVAIIQGPPGTGKTFIALQVIKFLLCNPLLLNGQPIVLVSNTNHSLDHLLEMVIRYAREMTGSTTAGDELVIRLGGRSKSDLVSGVTLFAKNEGYATKVYTDQQLTNTRQKIFAFQTVLSCKLENIEDFVLARQKLSSAGTYLRMFRNPNFTPPKDETPDEEEEAERNLEMSLHNLIPIIGEGIKGGMGTVKKLKSDWNQLTTLLSSLVGILEKQAVVQQEDFDAVKHFKPEPQALRAARVFGMTVTGSAKHKTKILEKVKPIMVIVEEAAHVVEATVVAGLTKSCKRLLLIGDHKQLRPATADYELTKANHLDVSMMERFVRNAERKGLKTWTQLDTQRRMRPEIARLITPTIYEELYDDPIVTSYPNVKGMEKNLFFLDHGEFEEKAENSTSFVNLKEADFVINLCLYLIGQGNEPAKITIITTYLGQKLELEKRMKQTKYYKTIRICCVDGFQGEENDIILLSLVRSNDNRSIGFLATNNRVCVALSRARHGMYIVGNMSGLAARSRTWADIQETLISGNSIGKSLRLRCDYHGGLTSVNIQTAKETFQVQNGKTKKCFCPTLTSGVWERSAGSPQPIHAGRGGAPNSKIQNGDAEVKKIKSTISSLLSIGGVPSVPVKKDDGNHSGKNDKKDGGCGRMFSCGHPCEIPRCNMKGHTAYNCKQKCVRICNGGHKCPGSHACYLPCPILTDCFRQVSTTCPGCKKNVIGLCCVLLPYQGRRSQLNGESKKATLCVGCQPKRGGDNKKKRGGN